MNEDNAFLPHFLDEEIYIIEEPTSTKDSMPKPLVEEPVLTKEITPKPVVEEPSSDYEKPQIDPANEKEKAVSLTYQGQNSKGILLIVNSIVPEEQAFLEKVLSAVKLTIDDCTLLQLSENSSSKHHALIEQFHSDVLINLGGQGLSFLQSINNYKISFVADKKKVLQVDNLKSIMNDVAKKKQLWKCLQQLF